MFLYLTIYMQGVLDYSPLEAGLRFLPLTVLGFIVAPISGALSNKIPIRVLLGTGLAVVGVGLLLMHGVSPDSEWTTLLAGFLVAGIGIGITNPGIGQAAIAVVPVEKSGMGSGINTTFRQVGIATGVAGARGDLPVAGRLEAGRAAAARARTGSAKWSPRAAPAAVAALPLPPAIHAKAVHAADVAFVSGFNEIILIAAILSFVGAALGFALVRSQRLRAATPARPSPPAGRRSASSGNAGESVRARCYTEPHAARAADREPAADRAGRTAARRRAERDHRGDGRGEDRARPLARPADGRQGESADRPARGRGGLGRGRLRPARRDCWTSRSWRSWPSGCRRAPRRSCWGGGSPPAGGPAPSSPAAPPPPRT